MEKELTCCFTGHRPKSLPFGYNEQDPQCVKLRLLIWDLMNKLIKENLVTHFISGMALGIDQMCAEMVIALRKKHPEITLECAFPCETQAVKWSETQRDRYYWIAEHCDKETMLQRHYDKDCMQKRNRYMVDSSQIVLAVWNGKPSGTGNTVRYAQEQGKTVFIINPETLETRII